MVKDSTGSLLFPLSLKDAMATAASSPALHFILLPLLIFSFSPSRLSPLSLSSHCCSSDGLAISFFASIGFARFLDPGSQTIMCSFEQFWLTIYNSPLLIVIHMNTNNLEMSSF